MPDPRCRRVRPLLTSGRSSWSDYPTVDVLAELVADGDPEPGSPRGRLVTALIAGLLADALEERRRRRLCARWK